MSLSIIILAAGQGTRMRSKLPKVLHEIAGKSLLQHVIDTAKSLNPSSINVVYGHGGEEVKKHIGEHEVNWVEQIERLGTGHAVAQAKNDINDSDDVLILYGDVPLIKKETLETLLSNLNECAISLLTVNLSNPMGYGRIIRNQNGEVTGIVEQKDATSEQLNIQEVNTGILAANGANLKGWLSDLKNSNAQNEYYLTDIIGFASDQQKRIITTHPSNRNEVEGVNNRMQLAELERAYQSQRSFELLESGVTLRDPFRVEYRGTQEIESDVEIDVNVILEGHVVIKTGSKISANSILKNCVIGSHTIIKPNSIIEEAIIGENCTIGPFARIRPGTELKDNSHIGNFVEIKKSTIDSGSKANHLAYIGDTTIGKNVNVGAGTITCNYDGVNKHQTVIKDNAFIGSDTQLVAPVTIGAGATIAAGSTITKDVSPDVMCISRVKQKEVNNWKRPVKKKS